MAKNVQENHDVFGNFKAPNPQLPADPHLRMYTNGSHWFLSLRISRQYRCLHDPRHLSLNLSTVNAVQTVTSQRPWLHPSLPLMLPDLSGLAPLVQSQYLLSILSLDGTVRGWGKMDSLTRDHRPRNNRNLEGKKQKQEKRCCEVYKCMVRSRTHSRVIDNSLLIKIDLEIPRPLKVHTAISIPRAQSLRTRREYPGGNERSIEYITTPILPHP